MKHLTMNTIILKLVLATKFKTHPSVKHVHDLTICMCGSNSHQILQKEKRYSPVCIDDGLQITIALDTVFCISLALFYFENVF